MDNPISQEYILQTMREFIETPSPVGYYKETIPLLERYANELGYQVEFDRKKTGYIKVPGKDTDRTICVGAHMDTLGLIVRRIDKDGMIRTRNLGGINYNNIEGETATIVTRDGRRYTGLVTSQSHSVHVFDDARTLERNETSMMIILDEPVTSEEDVRSLGIRHGDTIYLDPRFTVTPNGYIKSRFIDDKACVACALSVIKYMKENNITPSCNVWFAFPYYEEIGHGGAYVPPEISQYIALDIALIGPDYDGGEDKVSICAKDNFSPYDYDLTTHLIEVAEKNHLNYAVDIFYRYGTDANAAIRSGNNVQAAAFGMGTFCSHGVERTHISGVMETAKLLAAFLQEA
ncbi:MAG: M42 family metallopeptidase [Lachnospiraceae bacterium]|nr:M42 family metallopeptidase [Lachnospiraceae bacterium]